jgi:ABC-type glycerol-3-phosphate transport system substrate-binding protein
MKNMEIFVGVFILALCVVSSGSAQTAKRMSLAQLAAYNKPDREKVLYEGAKAEGKITWYTSLAGGSYKDLAAAFEAKYPGVKVESYRGTRQELAPGYWPKARPTGTSSTRSKPPFRC